MSYNLNIDTRKYSKLLKIRSLSDNDDATVVDVLSSIFSKYKINKFFKKTFMFGWLKK